MFKYYSNTKYGFYTFLVKDEYLRDKQKTNSICDEVAGWLTANCVGKYRLYRAGAIVEILEELDAVAFRLQWCE